MRIPTFEEAEWLLRNGEATPLDEFVYNNEPEGELEEQDFRKGLRELIEFIWQSARQSDQQDGQLCSQCGENVVYENDLCWDCLDG